MPEDQMKTAEPHPNAEDSAAMEKYGIVRIPVDYFHYGEFRYTSLKDAVAQAERSQRSA